MARIQDIDIPHLEFAEAAAPGTPAAGIVRVYAKTDGTLYQKDDAGTETALAGAAGSVATDALWDAAGDLAIGTGANTAAKLAIGANATVLTSNGTTATWAAGGAVPNEYVGSLPYWAATSSTGTLAANRVYYMRMLVNTAVTVTTAYFRVWTQAGNLDLGIYNEALTTLLGSTGSFACPAAGAQSQALTGSVALSANTIYYAAYHVSSGSLKIPVALSASPASGGWNLVGQQDVALPLPATPSVTWEVAGVVPAVFFK